MQILFNVTEGYNKLNNTVGTKCRNFDYNQHTGLTLQRLENVYAF